MKYTVPCNRTKKPETIYHIRKVDNMFIRLIQFLCPFNGAAAKYLQNYVNWFLLLERNKASPKKIGKLSHLALSTDRAWLDFKNKNINIYYGT